MNETKGRIVLIFVKNPVLGKVKTRLAASIGEEKALQLYHRLLQHTFDIVKQIESTRRVCYSDDIEEFDVFDQALFEKTLQKGENLGARMANAFEEAFADGYREILIIGSDCWEMKASFLEDAFNALERFEVVVGPAFDGGYYLLGLKEPMPILFEGKKWSTDTVLQDTLNDLNQLDIAYDLLPGLSDIDELEDLPDSLRKAYDI